MIFWELFWGFLKVGCFSFGGAYSAIPLIREVVLNYKWMDDEVFTYLVAVSESTPGPIMVNLATYVGSDMAGVLGAALATLAVIMPAFVIILVISLLLKNALDNPYVKAVLGGITPCVIGIILAIGGYMVFQNCFGCLSGFAPDWKAMLLTALLALVCFGYQRVRKKPISPITLILVAAVFGMIGYSI